MIKVLYSPQLNDNDTLTYDFQGEKIIATLNGQIDEFDFTGMPNGKAENITSELPINPVIEAERVDGILKLTLLNLIRMDATEEEKFPTWQEV